MLGKTLQKLTDGLTSSGSRRPAVAPFAAGRPPAAPPITDAGRQRWMEAALAEAEALQLRQRVSNVEKAINTPSIVDYIENTVIDPDSVKAPLWDFSKAKRITLAPFQKRILTHVLTVDPRTGRFPYRTVIWSAPKKSGKTAIAGFVGAWFAEHIEAPNLILLAANTQGQSFGRIHASMLPTLKANGAKHPNIKIELKNGTIVQSITNNPQAEAGANYGLVMVSELWGWDGDRAKTLWAETMPVPTKLNSMRWVETYVGYEDSSAQLLDLWLDIFTDTTESKLQPDAEAIPELADIQTTDAYGNPIPCCYRVPKTGMFLFVDHEHRLPWQQGEDGEEYYRGISVGLTDADIMRLVHNRWQKTDTKFITPDMLNSAEARGAAKGLDAEGLCLFEGLPRRVPQIRKMTLAIDASQGRIDTTALAGTYSEFDETIVSDAPDGSPVQGGIRYSCGFFRAYQPTGEDFDLDEIVGQEVVRLWRAGMIKRREPTGKELAMLKLNPALIPIAVFYDPMQMHQVAVNLKKSHKLLITEFQQGHPRIMADTLLHRVFKAGNIDIPVDGDLHDHLDAAKAQAQKKDEIDARIRIVKPKTGLRAIDGAVALSMSVYSESLTPPPRRRTYGLPFVGKTKGL